jgi:hypothetical protein
MGGFCGRGRSCGRRIAGSQLHVVTAVGPYEAFGDQGYLGFYVRQALRWGDRLPAGLEATIDVTNLLAQGYQPFLSADGRTLYLAQSPRMLRAGLSFSFLARPTYEA